MWRERDQGRERGEREREREENSMAGSEQRLHSIPPRARLLREPSPEESEQKETDGDKSVQRKRKEGWIDKDIYMHTYINTYIVTYIHTH